MKKMQKRAEALKCKPGCHYSILRSIFQHKRGKCQVYFGSSYIRVIPRGRCHSFVYQSTTVGLLLLSPASQN